MLGTEDVAIDGWGELREQLRECIELRNRLNAAKEEQGDAFSKQDVLGQVEAERQAADAIEQRAQAERQAAEAAQQQAAIQSDVQKLAQDNASCFFILQKQTPSGGKNVKAAVGSGSETHGHISINADHQSSSASRRRVDSSNLATSAC
ncbi:MAG: hypothetical protein Q4E13_12335 [Clostridia bacterium]|nr:hypothetical protein [Clostridia bacterium]